MPANQYSVRCYTPGGVLLRVINLVQSARYRLAENEVGDFDVTVPFGDGTVPGSLKPPNYVEFWRDNVFAFGGITKKENIVQEGRQAFYTASGPSYMVWLAMAVVKSVTGTGDVTFASDNLDDVMKNIVRTHVLDTNSYFVCATDSGLSGVTDTYIAPGYEYVIESLQNIATRAKDTQFDIIRDTDGALRFRTWTPSRGADKSKGTSSPVLFDMVGGNLSRAEYTRDGNGVRNAAWGGGPGDKAARYIYPPSGDALLAPQSILDWGRSEAFLDAGSETTGNVAKKLQEFLDKESVPVEEIKFDVTEFGRYRFGVDYDFGTKVTCMWGDIMEFTDTIKGVEVRLDAGSNIASVSINVGGTLTGDGKTRASILLGKYLQDLRKNIGVVVRH